MCEIKDEDAKVKDKSGDANDEKVAACQLENLAMTNISDLITLSFSQKRASMFCGNLISGGQHIFFLDPR